MHKFLAVCLTLLLMAGAFFLPAQLSQWNDQLLLDEPHILQEEEREGFAESVGLTVAEKVLLLRSGTLDSLRLVDGAVQGTYTANAEGEFSFILGPEEETPVEYDEDLQHKWTERLAAVQSEVRTLQIMGGLPMTWAADSVVECVDRSQILYVDRDSQMSFLVYWMSLRCGPYALELAVDAQSGRVLSFSLYWGRDGTISWGLRGASSFGSTWREYWGLDNVSANWYNEHTRSILEDAEARMQISGEYNAVGDISFTYGGQSLHIPLLCWAYSGGTYSLHWNP